MNGPDFQYDGLTAFAPVTNIATSKKKGLLSAADKAKLDALFTTLPACRVYHSVNQALASGASVVLAFDSERYDTQGYHNPATNNSRLTVPTDLGGLYGVWCGLEFAPQAGGTRLVQLRVNGTIFIGQSRYTPSGTDNDSVTVTAPWRLAAGDYVEVVVTQASGVAINILAAPAISAEFALTMWGY